MTDKISPALDPAAYLAMSAQLVAGVGDPNFLAKQTDELLSACQAGDYTVLIRHHNSLVISSQLAAHQALQRAQQCTDPVQYKQWLIIAQEAQKMSEAATKQVQALTNTEEKLRPYHNQNLIRAMTLAQAKVDEREIDRRVRIAVMEERLKHKPLPVSEVQQMLLDDAARMKNDWVEENAAMAEIAAKRKAEQPTQQEEPRESNLLWYPSE